MLKDVSTILDTIDFGPRIAAVFSLLSCLWVGFKRDMVWIEGEMVGHFSISSAEIKGEMITRNSEKSEGKW